MRWRKWMQWARRPDGGDGQRRKSTAPVALPPEKLTAEADICTRLCGKAGCQCGGTARGLFCLWSYYRPQ